MAEESYDNYAQEESRKRPLDDTTNERVTKKRAFSTDRPLIKLLVPNYAAGALIGKGGTLIGEMQTRFGGTIRLSPNRELYPGTDERIVVISAEVSQLGEYCSHIMEKVKVDQNQQPEHRPRDEGRGEQVKFVLTNSAAGLLIGKGGATIKGIQEDTKAKMTITNREESTVPGERVLTMSGSFEQRMEGCTQVIGIIAEEPSNMANNKLKYMSGGMGMGMGMFNNRRTNAPSNNQMSGFQGANVMNNSVTFGMGGHQNRRSKLKTNVQIQMEVPDILVGAIMGKQGQIIHELHQFTGAKIKFSPKNEYVPGTTDRILTITGDITQTGAAYDLVNQRVDQVENELGTSLQRY